MFQPDHGLQIQSPREHVQHPDRGDFIPVGLPVTERRGHVVRPAEDRNDPAGPPRRNGFDDVVPGSGARRIQQKELLLLPGQR